MMNSIGEKVLKNKVNNAIKDTLPSRKARPVVKTQKELQKKQKAGKQNNNEEGEDKRTAKQKKMDCWMGKLDNMYTILSAEEEGKYPSSIIIFLNRIGESYGVGRVYKRA